MSGSEPKPNPTVFFDIEVDGYGEAGRMEIELYADTVPRTAENFRCLCTGEKGLSRVSGLPLSYKGCTFHRIVPGFMIGGGDITKGDGSGGESIYGKRFADESFEGKAGAHTGLGYISMANTGKDANNSQFFITLKTLPTLNGVHVVVGKIQSGDDICRVLEMLGTSSGAVSRVAWIANCGEKSGAYVDDDPACG
jgi:peptidylprolyl isomerase